MILVYIESHNGKIKKSSLEAISFGQQLKTLTGLELGLLASQTTDTAALADMNVRSLAEQQLDSQDPVTVAQFIAAAYNECGASHLVLSGNSLGKAVAGVIAAKLKAALLSGVKEVLQHNGKICFKKSVFSGKANAIYSIPGSKAVISIMPNSVAIVRSGTMQIEKKNLNIALTGGKYKINSLEVQSGKTPLTEAEVVVSAGRGMKDPSNWGMIEELADLLGATTACSRPVADIGWRPHHEHVGQTGIAIRPNVYIAIGISGAIQHLAGVNSSRKIIVINKDPEAPFFKAADYGVVGDLFDVVPKLNAAIKKSKSENS